MLNVSIWTEIIKIINSIRNSDTENEEGVSVEPIEEKPSKWKTLRKIVWSFLFKLLFCLISLVLMNYLYLISLEPCPKNPPELVVWLEWLRNSGNTFVLEVTISSLLYCLVLFLWKVNYLSWYAFLVFTIDVMWLYNYQGGANLHEHGAFNGACLLAFIVLMIMTYGLIRCLISIIRKGKIAIFILSSIVIFTFLTLYFVFLKDSWSEWKSGFHGAKIEDIEGVCKVLTPNYWELTFRDGLLNFQRYTQKWHEFVTNFQMEMLNEELRNKPNLKRLGFPRTENLSNDIQYNLSKLRDFVKGNMIDMDDPSVPQSIKDNVEFIVDISEPDNHRLYIDVKRNNTRAEEVKKIREKVLAEDKANNIERIDKNLLVIYFDNLSRQHFHRTLKRFANILSEISGKEESEYELSEFMRYHSVNSYTSPNHASMFYGSDKFVDSESSNVFRYFSQNGFLTAYIVDIWVIIEWSLRNEVDYLKDPFYSFDHYTFSFNWDYNHNGRDEPLSIAGGQNSYVNRWLYGYNLFDIQFEYVTQIWKKYPDVRKFVRFDSNYNHEWTGELVKTQDESYEKFLRDFHAKGYLKDTEVMIVSDHGVHFVVSHTPIFPDDSRHQENYFPALFILSYKDTPKKNLNFLKNNQQQFMGSFDIYTTLKSFAVGKASKNDEFESYSIYHEDLPKGRECENSKGINYKECYCRSDVSKIHNLKNRNGYFYIQF